MSFEAAFQHTVIVEGGYSNNPNDSGGETMWGITVAVARLYGYSGPMKDLQLGTARDIYRQRYWDLLHLSRIDQISPVLAEEMFDTAVNCGASVPVPFLQRALNVFNRQQKDYADIPVDGLCGAATAKALREYINKRGKLGEQVMMAALNSLQGVRYIEIAERRPKDEDFAFGQIANRVA